MEFKQLQSFTALAEEKSFTKAAERLYVSQPTVSAHIRELEEELSANLVVRSTHSVEITLQGQALYEYAVRMLSLRDAALDRFREQEQVLQIGTSTVPAAYLLPRLLPGFSAAFPDVETHLQQSDSGNVIEGVEQGRFDVGFTGMRTELPGLSFIPVCKDHLVLIAPNKPPFDAWTVKGVPVGDLYRHPFIVREEGSGTGKMAAEFLSEIGIGEGNRRIAAQVNEPESMKRLTAAGFGLAIISWRTAEAETEAGQLLAFDLPGVDTERSLYLTFRSDAVQRPAVSKFIKYVKEHGVNG